MELSQPALGITDMAISRDGSLLLTSDTGGMGAAKVSRDDSGAGTIRLWDLLRGEQLQGIVIPDIQEIFSVSVSPDNKYALAAGTNTSDNGSGLTLWEIATGKQVSPAPDIEGDVTSASFSPDGRYILAAIGGSDWGRFGLGSAATDPALSLYDASTGKEVRRFRTTYPSRSLISAGSRKYLMAVFSPDGKQILSGGYDGIVRLWDVQTGKELRTFKGHSTRFDDRFGITGIAFSSDGKYALSSAEHDSSARLWNVETGSEVRTFAGLDVSGMGFLGAWGAAFSPDNKRALITAVPLGIWDVSSGKQTVSLQMSRTRNVYIIQNTKSMSAVYHPRHDMVLLHANDGSIRIFDAATGKERGMLVGFDDGEWIILTSEGYYNASAKGARYLTVNLGGQDYTVDVFYDVFYRPDIVMATLRGEDTQGLATLTMNSAVKNPPPFVEFTSMPAGSADPQVKVCYRVKSNGGGIGEVRLFQNGKLVRSDGYYREMAKSASEKQQLLAMTSRAIYDDMRSIAVKGTAAAAPIESSQKGDLYEECAQLVAIPGENEVSVSAFNRDNTVQSPLKTAAFTSSRKADPAHLYILAIGVDQYRDKAAGLKYAVKDARDIGDRLRQQAATVYDPKNIHVVSLVNEQATKVAIQGRIDELARTIRATDSFILFVAGHGILLQNQYYMLTADFDGTADSRSMISSNELVEMSKKIKSLSQLFIFDTCHAGGVDSIVSGLYDARMSVLAKKMGLHIYASASSLQEAQDGYQGNGLFTYTLLDGLNNKKGADRNNDNTVSLVELGEYAKQATTDISKKNGHAQTPLIINFGKDSPLYRLK